MSTEDKICETFEKQFNALDFTQDKDAWGNDKYKHPYVQCLCEGFSAGYMALLNELEPVMMDHPETFYRLPEGVEKP